MRVLLCYIAVSNGPQTDNFAARFVASYHEYPPAAAHDTVVASNGGALPLSTVAVLSPLSARMLPRRNDGFDIGAYIEIARGIGADYDAMLCCGENVHFHRAGWLARFIEAWSKFGPGMYGAFSSNLVRPHLNTTGFFCAPGFLANYPLRVVTRQDRYEFEHGANAFWRRLWVQGLPVRLVTWDGEWEPRLWRMGKNIMWRGDQSNCLMRCKHMDNWEGGSRTTRQKWSAGADAPFR